jgi:hypothetical protein
LRGGNKITFYPLQTNKIYPQLTNSFSSVNSVPSDSFERKNTQPNLGTVEDLSRMNFDDNIMPSSSNKHNPSAYIKTDTYPKFPPNINDIKIGDSESETSSVVFKTTRTSPDGDESKETDNNNKK